MFIHITMSMEIIEDNFPPKNLKNSAMEVISEGNLENSSTPWKNMLGQNIRFTQIAHRGGEIESLHPRFNEMDDYRSLLLFQ